MPRSRARQSDSCRNLAGNLGSVSQGPQCISIRVERPSHQRTSASARDKIDCGMLNPRVSAVFMLICNS